jgi:hypothetical protein
LYVGEFKELIAPSVHFRRERNISLSATGACHCRPVIPECAPFGGEWRALCTISHLGWQPRVCDRELLAGR